MKQRERDAVRKHNDEKLLAAEAADIEAAVRAKRRDVAERELDAARERAARDAERRAAARHDAAVARATALEAVSALPDNTAMWQREQAKKRLDAACAAAEAEGVCPQWLRGGYCPGHDFEKASGPAPRAGWWEEYVRRPCELRQDPEACIRLRAAHGAEEFDYPSTGGNDG